MNLLEQRSLSHILLVGSHEGVTDTLVLLQFDLREHTIALISIPRDLYFHGRKINQIYKKQGINQLLRTISAATGIDVKKYTKIDMYAFIDVINLLGGIEVELKEDLIDPTYRTRDNGVWSTLYFPRGRHLLNGIEVLRIVRSRYRTSDFGRAKRQQQILHDIIRRAKSIPITDIQTLYSFVRILLNYVETNLSPLEILDYLSRRDSISISGTLVLSTDNILYADYENLRAQGLREEDVQTDFDKGAYILIPLENEWEFFRAYIRTFLEGH